MRSIPLQVRPLAGPFRSRRLLALAGDERLVEQLRSGNEAAFEVAFERHGPGILSFCRHMLGSREEAEDAVQHTFAAAYRALLRDERDIALKAWLYAIARNRCLSVLRGRRDELHELAEPSGAGLVEEVERRAELRELLSDLADLPAEPRAALLLAEVGGLSHAEVAGVLGCEVARVKALVYRARQSLMERRDARETPCEEIREQLANLRGGALRRGELRHHLRACPGCREFRDKVRQQRGMLAVALPAVPSVGLKSSVLGAAGLGGGAAGGGAALAGLGGAGSTAGMGSAMLAKVAVVGVLAGGGVVAGDAAVNHGSSERPSATPAEQATPGSSAVRLSPDTATPVSELETPADSSHSAHGEAGRAERRPEALNQRGGDDGPSPAVRVKTTHGKPETKGQPAHAKAAPRVRAKGEARGPVEAPPVATPVHRGPPEDHSKPDAAAEEAGKGQ